MVCSTNCLRDQINLLFALASSREQYVYLASTFSHPECIFARDSPVMEEDTLSNFAFHRRHSDGLDANLLRRSRAKNCSEGCCDVVIPIHQSTRRTEVRDSSAVGWQFFMRPPLTDNSSLTFHRRTRPAITKAHENSRCSSKNLAPNSAMHIGSRHTATIQTAHSDQRRLDQGVGVLSFHHPSFR